MDKTTVQNQNDFIGIVERIVEAKINELRPKEWHIGKITGIFNKYLGLVMLPGATQPVSIPLNPNVQFFPGEQVIVLYINGDAKNKYVLSKCATGNEQ